MDYCACHGDMSLTFVARRAVRKHIEDELNNKEIRREFDRIRRERRELQQDPKITPIRPGKTK